MAQSPLTWLYALFQWLIDKIFSPEPPAPGAKLHRPKIAIIGAGLTGVSAASHCVGHGFEVTLFEAGGPEHIGGIWTVSSSSSISNMLILCRRQLTISRMSIVLPVYKSPASCIDSIHLSSGREAIQSRIKSWTRSANCGTATA